MGKAKQEQGCEKNKFTFPNMPDIQQANKRREIWKTNF